MPTPRKPKKAVMFFVIAALVAVIFAVGAIGVTMYVIGINNTSAEQAQQKALADKKKAEEDLLRLKNSMTRPVVEKIYELKALVDIPSGVKLRDNMVAPVELAKGDVMTAGAITDPFEAIGKLTISGIKAGEVVTKSKLVDSSGGVPIKEGMRAVTIAVDSVGGVNGAIQSGSAVDVLTILPQGDHKLTRTILQNIPVVSVGGGSPAAPAPGQQKSAPSGSVSSVTLAVTPQQAEMLVLANAEGKFHLTLRSELDKNNASVRGMNVDELISGVNPNSVKRTLPSAPKIKRSPPMVPVSFSDNPPEGLPYPTGPEPPSQTFTMTIYKGTSSEEKTFDVNE